MAEGEKRIRQHQLLHEKDAWFGSTALWQIPACIYIINARKPAHILDYGCGKGVLIEKLRKLFPRIQIDGYDPAVPKFANRKAGCLREKYDLILCFAVLEHIPEFDIPDVLADIRAFGENVFFLLCHVKATHILPDGTNAHCTVKPLEWYQRIIGGMFPFASPVSGHPPKNSFMLTFPLSLPEMEEFRRLLLAPKRRSEAVVLFLTKLIPVRRWRKSIRAGLRKKIIDRQTRDILSL